MPIGDYDILLFPQNYPPAVLPSDVILRQYLLGPVAYKLTVTEILCLTDRSFKNVQKQISIILSLTESFKAKIPSVVVFGGGQPTKPIKPKLIVPAIKYIDCKYVFSVTSFRYFEFTSKEIQYNQLNVIIEGDEEFSISHLSIIKQKETNFPISKFQVFVKELSKFKIQPLDMIIKEDNVFMLQELSIMIPESNLISIEKLFPIILESNSIPIEKLRILILAEADFIETQKRKNSIREYLDYLDYLDI